MLDICVTMTRRQLRRTCALPRPHRERIFFPSKYNMCMSGDKKTYWETISSLEDMHSYCIRCRRATDTLQAIRVVSKNGRRLVKGKCRMCGVSKTRFVGGSVQKGLSYRRLVKQGYWSSKTSMREVSRRDAFTRSQF